jgi:fructose-bisphosphate aldolase class I
MDTTFMAQTLDKLLVQGKGIHSADQSIERIHHRIQSFGQKPTEEKIAEYRSVLFESDRVQNFLSGIIFHDHTFNAMTTHGALFP